jgi:hypothetical protein
MSSHSTSKINQLLRSWPHATVALANWLKLQGVYQQLAQRYVESRWIERVGFGAYIKAGDLVSWAGALFAIQQHAKLPIHVAAKTALELHGHNHFITTGKKTIIIFGDKSTLLPTWFKKFDWGVKIKYFSPQLFLRSLKIGLTEKNYDSFSIQISSRERAILELLFLVPVHQQYEESKLIFEGLRTLRPQLLQSLLEKCHSIKVKRLFLHLAEATNQPWFEDLNLKKINLGKGKRVIGVGGKFDSKYNISVPIIHDGDTFVMDEIP